MAAFTWAAKDGFIPTDMRISCENGADWDEALRAAGYKDMEAFGYEEEFFHCITVYVHKDATASWRYYVEVSLAGCYESVFISDFPNMMAFLLQHAPLIQATANLRMLEILSRVENSVLSVDEGILGDRVAEQQHRAHDRSRLRRMSLKGRYTSSI